MASDNKFIEEDFERAIELEGMYILEQQRQEEEEYYQWVAERHKNPAKLEVIKRKKGVNHDKI